MIGPIVIDGMRNCSLSVCTSMLRLESRKALPTATMMLSARRSRIPSITIGPIIANLESRGLLTSNEKEALLPGRETSRIRLQDILDVVRSEGETGSLSAPRWDATVSALCGTIDESVSGTLGERTLSDLLDERDAAS